ncbi:hypothetical protein BKA62DRAFT_692180 [Auriculariales sp. MPI-PUGE-AT-0066]|nr:hypothetical protein BKA62DRAFT_692180 [Auriculariales sp. MPI-PUGE-AT-0066]
MSPIGHGHGHGHGHGIGHEASGKRRDSSASLPTTTPRLSSHSHMLDRSPQTQMAALSLHSPPLPGSIPLPPDGDPNGPRVQVFRCEYCGRGFDRRSTLKTHENAHTEQYAYACTFPQCTRSYAAPFNAYRHVRTAHGLAGEEARRWVTVRVRNPGQAMDTY